MYQILLISLLILNTCVFSQNTKRAFVDFREQDAQFEVNTNDGSYSLIFYNEDIVETTFIPKGESFNKNSHAVVLKPAKTAITTVVASDRIEINSDGISIRIQKSPFQISYFYKNTPIFSEKKGYQKNEKSESIDFNITQDELLYGGGARAIGMNRRGHRLELYNKAHYGYEARSELMNYTMPIVMSSKMYAVHFDNAPIGNLDLDSKKDNTITYETISGRKTYQVITGDSWLDLIDNYTDLTGKQPLPPRWAFGNFSSRFGYHSQQEVERTVDLFFKEKIPVDAVIIDIYWFGKDIKGHMGNLEFLKDSFPNPEQMIKKLKRKGIKTILVTEPFILSTSNRWQEAVDKNVLAKDSVGQPYKFDFYFGNSGIIDIFDGNAKKWFWNIYKELAEMGVDGVWGDLGEPEAHPSGVIHATGTADEVHNIYGHDWARLVFEGYQTDFPDKRPFILMRSGFSGSQRFGLIPWSGDVSRSWGGLQSQNEIALQMGMQGLGYMHSDLGGFGGANLDDELYTRWLQFGVFQPIFRPHAQEEVPSEPVFREFQTKAFAKQSVDLRYKLLPYNYTLAFENNQTGAPFMRPLFFEEPDNQSLGNEDDSYLYGNDLLVAPIVKSGVKDKEVYFPKNNSWFDLYTGKKYHGGDTEMVSTHLDRIPTFVRAGAFIPMVKPMQTTKQYDANNLILHYYHDASVNNSHGKMYNDDGTTPHAFENGKYEILKFESELGKKGLEIEFEVDKGDDYEFTNKHIELIIHNIKKPPKHIKVNRKRKAFKWDNTENNMVIPLVWNTNKTLDVDIKF
ncbi:MAG: DUF4968 domain-containing protein [Flavobacteriaceae bacterium]|nr:DUF4968 domain-containing protein [Flavobacteriaceae bacterium]